MMWVKSSVSRLAMLIRHARYVPSMMRMAYEVVEAQDEVAQHKYEAAKERLKRVYRLGLPDNVMERLTASLLMAWISLKLGDLETAADLVPKAISDVSSIRKYASPAERAYLKYAARLVFEEATAGTGRPTTLDVGVEYDELDADQVRSTFRNTFPIFRSRYADKPQIQ